VSTGDGGDLSEKKKAQQRLFLDVITRGPEAFGHLVEILQATGNESLALKLLQDALIATLVKKNDDKNAKAASNKNTRAACLIRNSQETEDEVDSSQSQTGDELVEEVPLKK
jgi:hypothetical protein